MKSTVVVLAMLCTTIAVNGQSYRSLVDDGNDAYTDKKYEVAEKQYKESVREKPERIEGHFNLGNTAYQKSDIQAALDAYKIAATKARDKAEIAQTLYNVGNSYLKAAEAAGSQAQQQPKAGDLQKQGYQQAIEAYKHSLKLNPKDADARYNLVYAMKKLEELQNQDQNQNQDQDKKQDKKDDKKEDKENKNKDKQQDEQKKDQQDQDQQQNQSQKDQQKNDPAKQNEQQSQPKEQKMSKEQAEQILKALERDEKDLQKKVRAAKGSRVRVEKDW